MHLFLQFLNTQIGISGHIHRLIAGSMAGMDNVCSYSTVFAGV